MQRSVVRMESQHKLKIAVGRVPPLYVLNLMTLPNVRLLQESVKLASLGCIILTLKRLPILTAQGQSLTGALQPARASRIAPISCRRTPAKATWECSVVSAPANGAG